MVKREKSPVIRLPEDKGRVEQLERKLTEYQGRLERHRKKVRVEHPYWSPEQINCFLSDTRYKIIVLSRVLKDKKVKTYNLSREIAKGEAEGWFDVDAYQNACGVIDDYCLTGGQRARGGTGLK